MMPVTAVIDQPRASAPSPAPALAAQQDDFASVIARARQPLGKAGAKEAEEKARESAQEFVAVTLVQPLLQKLRETSQAAAPFAPSSGELQFRHMLDAQLSQRIVRASNFGIVDAVARSLMRQAGAAGRAS